MSVGREASQRLDQWLVQARFFKSRTRAAALLASGHLRSNGAIVSKPHHKLRVGEVLTFPQGHYIRVVKVLALASRRGSAAEARLLFEDLNPPESQTPIPPSPGEADGRPPRSRRPDKRQRRALLRLLPEPGDGA